MNLLLFTYYCFAFAFVSFNTRSVPRLILVEKKKETITESAGRQQKKKIGKKNTGNKSG